MRPENPRQPEGGIKRKKWVPRTGGKHAQAKRPSVKNQIRSIERLLKRDGVPAKLREEKERELEKLRDAGKDNARIEREKKLSTKYHKVKFFERVKLTRRIEQLEKRRDAKDEGGLSAEELDELARLREDLEYVMNFPRGEKYVSVLVKEGDTEHATKERARLRKLVKANLAEAAALGCVQAQAHCVRVMLADFGAASRQPSFVSLEQRVLADVLERDELVCGGDVQVQ